MKKNLLSALITASLLGGLSACTQAPTADKAKVEDAKTAAPTSAEAATLKVDPTATKVSFIGTKPTGQHNGTIGVTEGTIAIKNGTIESGKFLMDMNSVAIHDMDADGNGKLAGHLKSPDFFDTEKFPTASFEITSVQPYTEPADSTKRSLVAGATHVISGNLTLKGVTKNVSFPAAISLNGGNLSAKANFNIERTDWGLAYHSDKSLGDKFIRPTVNIGLEVVARP